MFDLRVHNRRHTRAVAALAASALAVLALAPALAQANKWSIQTTANGAGAEHSALYDMACEPESINACTAVGKQTIGGVTSPYAQFWNGSTWTNQSAEAPAGATGGELQADHCLSTTSCVAAGSYTTKSGTFSLVESWNGTKWSIQATPNPEGATETKLRGVSCDVITACIAVGSSNAGGKWATALRGNAGTWSLQTVPKPAESISSELNGVECISSTSCVAVGVYNTGASTYWAMAATWNGTEWSLKTVPKAVGSKKSILLDVSCSDASNCTAVGAHTNSENVQVTFAARWNGTSWSVENGLPGLSETTNSVLQNITCEDNRICVAVGDRRDKAGTWRPLAYRWQGTWWSSDTVAEPAGHTFALLEGVSCRITCLAIGWYTNSEGKDKTLGEVRETPAWTQRTISTPSSSTLSGIDCYGSSSCMATGIGAGFATAYFGATTWTELTPPKPAEITASQLRDASCLSEGGTCTAVGVYTKAGVEKPYGTRRVEAGTWTLYDPLPLPGGITSAALNDVSCTAAAACTAVGDFKEAGEPRTYVIRWNGTKWSVQASPNVEGATSNVLTSVSCASATICTAVGYAEVGGSYQPLIERWNGATWSIQSNSLPAGGEEGKLFGVSCRLESMCLAVGRYWDESGVGHAHVTELNGGSWANVAAPRPAFAQGSHLEDVACGPGSPCRAVGNYTTAGGGKAFAAEWDGVGWEFHIAPSPGTSSNFLLGVACPVEGICRGVGYLNSGAGNKNLAESYP